MRRTRVRGMKATSAALTKIGGSAARRWAWIIAALIGGVLFGAAVRAHNHATLNIVGAAQPTPAARLLQGSGPQRGSLQGGLSLQPEAERLRRRLGQRFLTPGREMTVTTGMLTLGKDVQPIRVIRSQTEHGEQVAIAFGNGAASLSWSATEGAKSASNAVTDMERSLLERIALDSADGFVLAQLREASYYTIARRAMPPEAGGSDTYTGPVWDVVRVGEPPDPAHSNVQSPWRIYYINSNSGLLERVVSREQETTVSAEISGWVDQGGEKVPTHITWSRDGQAIMDIRLDSVTYGPRQ